MDVSTLSLRPAIIIASENPIDFIDIVATSFGSQQRTIGQECQMVRIAMSDTENLIQHVGISNKGI